MYYCVLHTLANALLVLVCLMTYHIVGNIGEMALIWYWQYLNLAI